jgi:hypothetical protein
MVDTTMQDPKPKQLFGRFENQVVFGRMVAGDRSSFYHLLETGHLVDFGTWQIALRGAIGQYLRKRVPTAANVVSEQAATG